MYWFDRVLRELLKGVPWRSTEMDLREKIFERIQFSFMMVPLECVWGWNGVVDLTDCESGHKTIVHGISVIKAYIGLKAILLDTVCAWRIVGKNSPWTQFNSIRFSCEAVPLSDANVLAGYMRCTQESISKFLTLFHVCSWRSCVRASLV